MLVEPDVALTDWLLAVECGLFGWWFAGRSRCGVFCRAFAVVFAALAVASLSGGMVHGLFPDPTSLGNQLFWRLTLVAIGIAASAVWVVAADMLFGPAVARNVALFALILFVTYALLVNFVIASFALAILNYGTAGLFLLVAFVVDFARRCKRAALIGASGILMTFLATAMQQMKVAMPSLGLTHNAVYHLVSAVALVLVFAAARELTHTRGARAPC